VTLVQERRTLGLNQGSNEYRVSWGGVNVNRDSVRLDPAAGSTGVTVRDAVYTQDNPNSITWHLEAAKAGAYPFSVAYDVSGLSWWADHVLTVADDEQSASLKTWASIANGSGEDYQDAEIRLVMGEVRLLPPGPQGPPGPRGAPGGGAGGGGAQMGMAFKAMEEAPEAFSQQGYAEYTFYTLARQESLDSGDTKRIELASAAELALKKLYVYDMDMYGPNVALLYLFDNKKELGLGPLPPGMVRAYRQEASGRLTLLGEDQLRYTPVAETARLYLGSARDVTVEVNRTGYRRGDEQYAKDRQQLVSFVESAEYTVQVKSRKTTEIEMLARLDLPWADAEIVEAIPEAGSPRTGMVEWRLKIAAGAAKPLVVRIRHTVYLQRPE
jgi:hypothetical protein